MTRRRTLTREQLGERSKGDTAERILKRLEGRAMITIEYSTPDPGQAGWVCTITDEIDAIDHIGLGCSFGSAVRAAFRLWVDGGEE